MIPPKMGAWRDNSRLLAPEGWPWRVYVVSVSYQTYLVLSCLLSANSALNYVKFCPFVGFQPKQKHCNTIQNRYFHLLHSIVRGSAGATFGKDRETGQWANLKGAHFEGALLASSDILRMCENPTLEVSTKKYELGCKVVNPNIR